MLFNDNKDEKKSVTTRGIDFKNETASEPTQVKFDFWKSGLSLRIHPMLPPDKQTEYKKFDYDTMISTSLTPQNCYRLHVGLRDIIFPALKDGKKKFIGVQVAGDGLVGVGTGENGENPYIAIFKGIDSTTRKPENAMRYFFNDSKFIVDYEEESGECEKVALGKNIEMELFDTILKASAMAMSNAFTHSYRNVQDWYNSSLLDYIKDIARKNGIQVKEFGGFQKKSDPFGDDELPFGDTEKVSKEVDNINSFLD